MATPTAIPTQPSDERPVYTALPGGPSVADQMQSPQVAGSAWENVGKLGLELHDQGVKLGIQDQTAAGAAAVQRQPDGTATFVQRTPLNEWDEAYNSGGIAAYAAQTDNDIRLKMIDLRSQFATDPQGFQENATKYVKTVAAQAPMAVKQDILATGLGQVTQHLANLVDQNRAADVETQRGTLDSSIRNEVQSSFLPLARSAGSLGQSLQDSQAFLASTGRIQAWLRSKLNPIFKTSPEEVQNQMDGFMAQAKGEFGLGAALNVYQKTGNADSAVSAGDKFFYDTASGIPLDLGDKLHGELHRRIDEIQAAKRQDALQARDAILARGDDASAAAANGQDWEKVISRQEIRAALGPQADQYINGLDATADTASQLQWIKTASPAEIAARQQQLDPNRLDLPGSSRPTMSETDAAGIVSNLYPGATVTSGQRSPEHNAAVGGVPDSQHINATALDFVLPQGKTFADVKADMASRGLPVSELLDEGDHIHWAWGDKNTAGGVAADGTKRFGYAADLRRASAFNAALQQHYEGLRTDPAAYVVSASPMLQALDQTATNGDPTARPKYFSALLSQQSYLGVPAGRQRVLTSSQVDYINQQMLTAPPGIATEALGKFTAGATQNELDIMARQVAPKNRALAVAISMSSQNPGLTRDIITGQRFLAENPDAKPDDKIVGGTIDRLTGGSTGGWFSSGTGGLFQYAPDARASAMAAATALYARQQIGGKSGTLDQGALDNSMRQVLGKPFVFRGQYIVAPDPNMTPAQVSDAVKGLNDQSIKTFGNGQPVDASGRPVSSKAIAESGVLSYTGQAGLYRVGFPNQGVLGVHGNTDGAKTFTIDLGKAMAGGMAPPVTPPPAPPVADVMPALNALPPGKRFVSPPKMFKKIGAR